MSQRTKRFIFGEWLDDTHELTAAQIEQICDHAQTKHALIANYSLDQIFDLFDRVRKIWRDPESKYRLEAERVLPGLTGFSPEMIRLGLDELDALLNPDVLQKKIDTELQGAPRGLGYKYREETKTFLKWHPIGTVYHVLSGNVFLVGPSSLVEGLLTGNVNILKMPSEETFFLPLFIESLIECDVDGVVTSSLAVLEFASRRIEIIDTFKKHVDGIVVWGGEVAVQAYRSGLPSKTRLVIFGPKLSFAIITRAAFDQQNVNEIANRVARELSLWDQNACTAPQVCFIETEEKARAVLEAMPQAMKNAAKILPSGVADSNAAVDIRQLRSLFEIGESRGERAVRHSGASVDWTILLDREVTLEASPLNRTLRLIPYGEIHEVFSGVAPFKNYLQTVGVLAPAEEHLGLAQRLATVGALKIAVLGEMSGGDVDDPHDGAYDLPQLLNLVVTQWTPPKEGLTPFDVAPETERQTLIEARLRRVIRAARKSSFYEAKFKTLPTASFENLKQIKPLTRAEWEANMAPKTHHLATRQAIGGYVTRSGGSTGDPKFSFFDDRDWAAMCENAVNVFRACGLRRGDRIANFMLAGDLYGSFISFNHVDYLLGTTSFAFAGEYTPEGFTEVWRAFEINAVQGLPSVLVPLLRKCKQLEPRFKIEKVMYAGLPMSREDREWLHAQLGVKRIASVIGTTEAGQLAYQCEQLSGTFHHVADDYNHIEILDDAGAAVAAGVRGRLAVTTLMKTNYPLVRYLIGDAARWVSEPCPCGRKAPVIEYLGRWDDILSLGLTNLRYSELRAALEHLPISEMQLVASFKSGETSSGQDVVGATTREHLVVMLESAQADGDPSGANAGAGAVAGGRAHAHARNGNTRETPLEAQARDALFTRLPVLAEQHEENTLTVEIKIVAPGTLKRNNRSGKVVAIVDERPQATHIS